MIATKRWKCDCGCGETIEPGTKFEIRAGEFFKSDHMVRDCFEDAGIPLDSQIVAPRRGIPQKELYDLPLFSKAEQVEQCSLL